MRKLRIITAYLNCSGVFSCSEWFCSGFVAFPSSYNSTVCSLFQTFTKVGYSRRKPSGPLDGKRP